MAWARAHPHPELRETTIWDVFEAERPSLAPYVGPLDGFHAAPAAVSKSRGVQEPPRTVRHQSLLGAHPRAFGRGKAIDDPLHYIPVLARKPGALRNGAPFKDWDSPPAMRRVQRKLERMPNGDRQMVDVLSAVLIDGLEAVEAACAEASAEGVHSADVILNILARRREPPPPLTITTPDALRLNCAPAANCARYDSPRRPGHEKIAGAGRHGPAQALRHEGGV